jgi:hypothetical protein
LTHSAEAGAVNAAEKTVLKIMPQAAQNLRMANLAIHYAEDYGKPLRDSITHSREIRRIVRKNLIPAPFRSDDFPGTIVSSRQR